MRSTVAVVLSFCMLPAFVLANEPANGNDKEVRHTTVYRLKNAPATDLANAINSLLDGQRSLQQDSTAPVRRERDVIIVPEVVSNSLIVSATPASYKEIERLIRELDMRPSSAKDQALSPIDRSDSKAIETNAAVRKALTNLGFDVTIAENGLSKFKVTERTFRKLAAVREIIVAPDGDTAIVAEVSYPPPTATSR